MVDNPDQPAGLETYVPTTSAAVYLPRRNAHLYDASVAKWNAHNLLTYSSDMSDVAWTLTRATGSGTSTFTLTEDTSGSSHFLGSGNSSFTSGVLYTIEVEAKPNGRDWFRLNPANGPFPADRTVFFDVSTGVVGTVGGDVETTSIEATTDGFYLCTMTIIADATTSDTAMNCILAEADNVPTYTGDGVSGMIFRKPRTYRSDLNGVVANGDDGTYVATTAAAVEPTLNTAVSFPKKGLRWESSAATNRTIWSNDFSRSSWTKAEVTLTPAAAIGADGESSMTKMAISNTALGNKTCYESFSAVSNTTYCTSVDVRDDDGRYFHLRHVRTSANYSNITVDLATGTITQSATGGTSGTIVFSGVEDLGGGLYRVHLASNEAGTTLLAANELSNSATPTLNAGGGVDYVGVIGVGVYIGAAQTVLGSSPSSYIPTNGATVTRAAETLSIAGAKTPFNAGGISFKMSGLMTYADEGAAFQLEFLNWENTGANERISSYLDTGGGDTGQVTFFQRAGGVNDTVASSATSYSPDSNVPFSIASRNGATFINGAVDGTALTANTTPVALADLSAQPLELGGAFNGFISEVIVWGADIGDTGIAEASTP